MFAFKICKTRILLSWILLSKVLRVAVENQRITSQTKLGGILLNFLCCLSVFVCVCVGSYSGKC